jgi:hypothetical protein
MATTYDRIRLVLVRLRRRSSWDIADLAEQIRNGKQPEFKVRGDGTSPEDYMSAASIRRLVRLMIDLDLIELVAGANNNIRISEAGDTAIAQDNFDLQIRSSVRSYLYKNDVGMDKVKAAASALVWPDLPSADAIHDRLSNPNGIKVSAERFRTLMYLYAKAGGAERVVSVYYTQIV